MLQSSERRSICFWQTEQIYLYAKDTTQGLDCTCGWSWSLAWCSRHLWGVHKHAAFQVLSHDLEWLPQCHFRYRVPEGPRVPSSTAPPAPHGSRSGSSPSHPDDPSGSDLLLSVALRSKLEDDVFNCCKSWPHFQPPRLHPSQHLLFWHFFTLCYDNGALCFHRDL